MRILLAALLLLGSRTVHAATTVNELFAQTRAALERAQGIELDFTFRGETTFRGHALIVPSGKMLVETNGFTVWSDGDVVEVRDAAAKTLWTTAMHRAGTLLLSKYLHGVTDAYASATRFDETLVYKPKLAGTAVVAGRPMNVVSIEWPGGGWRWYFDRDDHLLRRQERIAKELTETIDYTNVRKLTKSIVRPRARGFAAKQFTVGGPAPGDAPQFSVRTLDGKTISSDSLRGRVTVVDFWATWCGPCRPSMKALQKLHETTRGLSVIGLRWNDTGDAAAFAKAQGITYALADAGDAATAFAVDKYGLPLLFVIGKDGRVIDYAVGYNGAKTDRWLEQTVAAALRSPSP
ncbi:MAG TPA: TlpA disulfide reductase family protein [Thermoanaerobaculia bacterium]|jgi:thiol-disulfide isomerase/thioredoxin